MHGLKTGWRAAAIALALASGMTMAAAKDTLTLGLPIEPTGLDPTIAAPLPIRQVTWGNIYEGLVGLNEKNQIIPLLATSWTISPDGLTYTFKLRPNVKFTDGTPFDSSIVKFSLDRARAKDSTNAQKQFFEPIESIETPDPLAAVIKLKAPTGLFLYHLAWGDAVMVDPKSEPTNRTDPVGTGPFKFKSWQRGTKVELVRNDDYWDKGVPKLAAVTFRFISDPQAQASALRAGDIDGMYFFTAPELFKEFEKDKRFSAVVGSTPGKVIVPLNNSRKPFSNMKVRQAMMSAIDRKAVIEAAYAGYGTPIGSHFAPTDPGYIDETGVWPFDLAKAKALLKEAGYPNGFSATMKCAQMTYVMRTCEVVQAMEAQIGINLKIEPSEFPAKWIQDVFTKHDYDVTVMNHAEPLDIGIYARPNYYFEYHNPAFDAIIKKADESSDAAQRDKYFGEAQKILAEQVPALYIFDIPQLNVLNPKLKGLWKNEPISEAYVRDAYWEN